MRRDKSTWVTYDRYSHCLHDTDMTPTWKTAPEYECAPGVKCYRYAPQCPRAGELLVTFHVPEEVGLIQVTAEPLEHSGRARLLADYDIELTYDDNSTDIFPLDGDFVTEVRSCAKLADAAWRVAHGSDAHQYPFALLLPSARRLRLGKI